MVIIPHNGRKGFWYVVECFLVEALTNFFERIMMLNQCLYNIRNRRGIKGGLMSILSQINKLSYGRSVD